MAAAVMCIFLEDAINTSVSISRSITYQGLDNMIGLLYFSKLGMNALAKSIQYLGGTKSNPRDSVAGQPPTIINPVNLVSIVAEKCLIITAYAAIHQM